MDQPTKALEALQAALQRAASTKEPAVDLALQAARLHEALGAGDAMAHMLQQVGLSWGIGLPWHKWCCTSHNNPTYPPITQVIPPPHPTQQVLQHDASNLEAIACLAAHHYALGQPEVAAVLYTRLLQLGHTSAEVWCNVGLCSFAADRLENCMWVMERALAAAGDDGTKADVWYNIGHMATRMGMFIHTVKYTTHHCNTPPA